LIQEETLDEAIFALASDTREIGKLLLARLKKQQVDVPLLPTVATDVMRLANSERSDAAELANLIQSDLALAGHVMRIANSAVYTPNASMVSLQQAIARLGMNLICEISLSAALNSKLFNAPGYEARLGEISQHAFCAAMWSKEVARQAQGNVESAFLCGLLHNIGRPALLQTLSEESVKSGLKVTEEQAKELEDILHQYFGQYITSNWEMPSIVCFTTRYSNDYPACKKHQDSAATVYAGALLAQASLVGDDLSSLAQDDVFGVLNLYSDQVSALFEMRDAIVSTVRAQ
jgi:HD-like signal output (HDOD) protein